MATPHASTITSPHQFPPANDPDRQGCSPHIAVIQQPVRRWERPWRHQRAIVLFAMSAEEAKLRLQLEDRIKPGEQVLQVIAVGD